jgi:hypothetical protein
MRGGRRLAARMASSRGHAGAEGLLRESSEELCTGCRTLASFLRQLGASRPRARLAMADLAELAGRLKPNGRRVSRSPLSDVLELEGLALAFASAALAWRSLAQAGVAAEDVVSARAERCETLAARVGLAASAAAAGALAPARGG